MALLDGLVRDRIQAVEHSFWQEIASREDALQTQQQESQILRVQAVEHSFWQENASREDALQTQQQESQILRGQLEALQSQLSAFHVHSG
jgi:biopolymer transport protein ExbB/TolQ